MTSIDLLRCFRPIYTPLRPIYGPLVAKLGEVTGWADRRAIREWQAKGKPIPPPYAYKQQTLRNYARKYHLHTLIETGTQTGNTVWVLRKDFSRIVTIELDSELHQRAVERFSRERNIECVCGDSAAMLPKIVTTLEEPALFWLDGHYQGGDNARGSKDTPISEELDAVLRHRISGHVVVIDDARNFNDLNDYPPIEELCRRIRSLHPGYAVNVEDDMIHVTPMVLQK
jgi:hypothetical protein